MEKNYIEEDYIPGSPSPISYEVMQKLCSYLTSYICKIRTSNEGQGTGFFCKMACGGQKIIKVLITNNHVLNKEDIIPGKIINFSTDDDKNYYKIIIDESRMVYTNYDYDVTIIQLKEKDNLDKILFFDIDEQIFENNYKERYKNKEIYLL